MSEAPVLTAIPTPPRTPPVADGTRPLPPPGRDPVDRLRALLDPGTFERVSAEDRSGMVVAVGRAGGTRVVAFASDPALQGGAMGAAGCAHVVAAYRRALDSGVPIIGIWHSGGARLAEGVASLDAVGHIFAVMTEASGVVPQISVVLGAAAGGAAYGPALTDVVVMAPEGRIFVTGPDVVRSVTGESVDAQQLGGLEPHARRSGVVHVEAADAADALARTRVLCELMGRPVIDLGPPEDRDLAAHLPTSPRRAYDVRHLVEALLDDQPSQELHARWAPNLVTTLGRLGGRTVGVLANNPLRLGGCLDSAAAEKGARFVRMCDAFGIPLVVLVDVPGYLPGVAQEWDGVVRRGAKLLHAFAAAVVPRVTLVLRKTYGGAYIAMNSRSLGATRVLSWPGSEVAVMGSVAAVRILHRRRLAEVEEGPARDLLEAELAADHELTSGGLERARSIGVVDEVVDPARTRSRIWQVLDEAPQRRGRLGNIPL